MKLTIRVRPKKDRQPSPKKKQKGIALVTVLSILSVLTVLSVAIISLAGTELRSARSYSDNVRTRQLSETVISMVVGQIRDATRTDKTTGGGLFGGGAIPLWASQPGMIRRFEAEGKIIDAFKLYSSNRMIIQDVREIQRELDTIRDWERFPERFVDLNLPSIGFNNKGQEINRYFPILDPRAKTIDKVEAFDYDDFPGVRQDKRLPMPVEWIYRLKDGKMGTLDASGKFVSTDPTAQPSEQNPMVSRIAFWADDETSKININTAAEAVPWDKPKIYTDLGKLWSQYQPVINEVQRYPGHPATTCLSAVFFPGKYIDAKGSNQLTKTELQALMEITPKVQWGGTEDGKRSGKNRLVYDTDRLYASVDDIVFNVEREKNDFVRLLPDGLERFERAKGFMTARSSAPELNVHGRPRISLWAFHENDSPNNRTTLDDTIEFCTSLGPKGKYEYFFQRRDATSRHGEFYTRQSRDNVNLYKYLMGQVYRDVPGYGKSLAKKYGSKQRAPFKSKHYKNDTEYKMDHFSIALQMFDYMRQVNIHDGNLKQPYADFSPGANSGFGQISGINLIGRNLDSDNGSSQQSSGWHKLTLEPRGSGRMYTISEVAMVHYNTAEVTLKSFSKSGQPTFGSGSGGSGDGRVVQEVLRNKHPEYSKWKGRKYGAADVGHKFAFIETGLIPEVFAVAQGFHQIHPKQTIRLMTGKTGYRKGVDDDVGIKINGVPLELWGESVESSGQSQDGPAIFTVDPKNRDARGDLPSGWYGWGGAGGYRLHRFGTFTFKKGSKGYHGSNFLANGTGPLSHFYCQTPVVVRDDEDLVITQNAPVQLVMYDQGAQGASTGNLVQVFNLRWAQPGEEVIVPRPRPNSSSFSGWTRRFRGAAQAQARKKPVFVLEPGRDKECVKSLIVSHGDVRLVSTKRNVPSELFAHHPLYEKERASHSMTWSIYPKSTTLGRHGKFAMDMFNRSLVEGVKYDEEMEPDFCWDPRESNRDEYAPLLSRQYKFPIDPSITRDFDNGIGGCTDGAYINKPDDGADDVPGSSAFNQKYPYYEAGEWKENQSYKDRNLENFNPNRMVPSSVMFGSLPSASQANAPWTTLLFRPNVAKDAHLERNAHLGEAGNGLIYTGDLNSVDGFEIPQFKSVTKDPKLPPDHIWLDFFWMPIVEPYPVSEPFSTSGKVNLNYQMQPFSYIKRATALAAVFKSERILAVPNSAGRKYKKEKSWNEGWHHHINLDFDKGTFAQWEDKFEDGEVFRTATEVCEMFLYPLHEDVSWDKENKGIRRWWDKHRLSGDNTLEQPYANIYPRVTTKSNTYKVYMTVQSLQKVRGTPANQFVGGQDQVTGEYRGSAVIERFLDPNDRDIPNYLKVKTENNQESMEQFYRYRVVNNRQFSH